MSWCCIVLQCCYVGVFFYICVRVLLYSNELHGVVVLQWCYYYVVKVFSYAVEQQRTDVVVLQCCYVVKVFSYAVEQQ